MLRRARLYQEAGVPDVGDAHGVAVDARWRAVRRKGAGNVRRPRRGARGELPAQEIDAALGFEAAGIEEAGPVEVVRDGSLVVGVAAHGSRERPGAGAEGGGRPHGLQCAAAARHCIPPLRFAYIARAPAMT